jgi:hypothetical protein
LGADEFWISQHLETIETGLLTNKHGVARRKTMGKMIQHSPSPWNL